MINPELQRLLWINFGWRRSLFVVILALTVSYVLSVDINETDISVGEYFYFYIFTVVWGGSNIFRTLSNEARSRTWYWQLILPLSPWQLVWTKLIGLLALPWLGGLLVFVPTLWLKSEGQMYDALLEEGEIIHLANALLLNTLCLFLGLLVREKNQSHTAFFEAVIYTLLLFGLFSSTIHIYRTSALFAFFSAILFSSWSIVGAWRIAVREKQHTPKPAIWIAFIAYLIGYVYFCTSIYGYSFNFYGSVLSNPAMPPLLSLWTLAYVSVFLHANRPANLNLFIDAIRQRDKLAIWRNTPPWLIVWPLFILTVLLLYYATPQTNTFLLIGIAALFFIIRDTAILLLFSLNHNTREPEILALLVLATLYLLLPWLATTVNFPELGSLFYLSINLSDNNNLAATALVGFAQAIAAGLLLWRLRFRSVNAGNRD